MPTPPTDTSSPDTPTPSAITFTPPLVERTGGIGQVLVDMMENQVRRIEQELREEFGEEKVPDAVIPRILTGFVSLEGTKLPRDRSELMFPDLSNELVLATLNKLVDARLLRESEDGTYELVHDTLAAHIYAQRDKRDVAMEEAAKMVKDAYFFHDKTKRLLTSVELAQVEQYEEAMRSTNRLSEEEWAFVGKSHRAVKQKRQRNNLILLGLVGLLILMTGMFVRSQLQKQRIEDLLADNGLMVKDLERNSELTKQTAQALKNSKSDRTSAFRQLRDVRDSMDQEDRVLVNQLTQGFLSEFSLFPFYNRGERLSETINEIVVGPNLSFIMGAAMDSPVPFFKNVSLDSSQMKPSIRDKGFLIPPSDFHKYGVINDMVLLDDAVTVITGHADGRIWRWRIDRAGDPELLLDSHELKKIRDPEDDCEPDEFGRIPSECILNIRQIVQAGSNLLVAFDSLIYEVPMQRSRPARFLIGFNRPINHLVVNPKQPGQFAAVRDNSGKIYLCDRSAEGIQKTFHPGRSTITSLAYSPDGKSMIAGLEDGDVAKMWDLRRPHIITDFKGHSSLISSIAFSKDGRRVLTGSWDQTAILWTAKGEIIKRLVGHQNRIRSVAFTGNGYAVTSSEDGDIKTWYLDPLAESERVFSDSIRALATSSQHDTIAFSLYDDRGSFYLWHWPSDQLIHVKQPIKRYDRSGDIVALAWANDGHGIVAASENTLTTFIDRSGKAAHEDYRGGGRSGIPATSSIAAVDISDDYVLIADRKSRYALLRSRTNPKEFIQLVHPNLVRTATFSSDGRMVLTGCDDGNAYLWDISGEQPTSRTLRGHSSRVVAVDFSPDDRYVLTGSYDNTARIWPLGRTNQTGDITTPYIMEGVQAAYRGHNSDVKTVAFAHQMQDDTYVFLTGSADKTVKIWEFNEQIGLHERPSVIRHLDELVAAAFLPGDTTVVSGSFDETIKVWRADDAERLIESKILSVLQ